jgi:hypothetical protein
MLVALDFQRKGNYLEKGGCKAALFSFGRQIRSLRAPVRPTVSSSPKEARCLYSILSARRSRPLEGLAAFLT